MAAVEPCRGIAVRKRVGRFELRAIDDHVELENTTGGLDDSVWLEAEAIAENFARLLSLKWGDVYVHMPQPWERESDPGLTTIGAGLFVSCWADEVKGHVYSQADEVERQTAAEWATEFLAIADDPTFVRSFDYLHNALLSARSAEAEGCLPQLSKAIEAIENYFGGEAQAGKTLQMLREIKYVKRLANLPFRDERHAPMPDDRIVKIIDSEKKKAIDITTGFIEAYLTYIREEREPTLR